MQLVKKITNRDVLGNVKALVRESGKKEGEVIPGYTVIGQVINYTTGESDNGPWVKLKGRFRATRASDDEVFASAVAMLPDEATDPICAALTLDDVSSIDMAFSVDVRIEDDSITGYVYVVKPLIAPSEDDPLERLAAQVSGTALPAPDEKKDDKKAAAK